MKIVLTLKQLLLRNIESYELRLLKAELHAWSEKTIPVDRHAYQNWEAEIRRIKREIKEEQLACYLEFAGKVALHIALWTIAISVLLWTRP